MYKYFIFLMCIIFCKIYAKKQFGRLDPHGSKQIEIKKINIQKNTNCKTCHVLRKGKLIILSNSQEKCITCHNKYPHSGIIEHTGKNLGKLLPNTSEKLNCLSCHRPHRFGVNFDTKFKSTKKISLKSSSIILGIKDMKLPDRTINKKAQNPMLKRDCTDCHGWSSLP